MKSLFIVFLAVAARGTSAAIHRRCEPNTVFNDYCNTCTCGPDGRLAACTYRYCDPTIWNKDGTVKSEIAEQSNSEQICEPHSTYKDYCNTCRCSTDGKNAACTLMACDKSVWNKDGTKKSKQTCKPHTTFNDYCNTCICGADGTVRGCTYMACDPSVWNKDGTLKIRSNGVLEIEESQQICQPHTTYKDYCNTCRCSADGKNAACTLMACDHRIWNKDGTLKIARNSFVAEESQ